ncbi:hypothetical protein [Paludisphaera soli]|uniref:hypothetical protein n=1 Tax=Paludisphaera soli TaxID=2712865 RepID=UPI0013EB41F7|nr:hypothetical protein [Paludisphaera soli]
MSQSGSERRPARFDVRAATAAALVFGVLGGGGALPQQGGKPSAEVPAREAEVEAPDQLARPGKPAPPVAAPAEPAPTPDAANGDAKPEAPRAEEPAPPTAAAPVAVAEGPLPPAEAAALRADAEQRLKALAPPADGSDAKAGADAASKLADKALAEVLAERARRLDEYDKSLGELAGLTNPESDPDRRIAEAKADLADLQGRLDRPVADLLPPVFTLPGEVDQAGQAQMKELIEGVKQEIKEYQDKLALGSAEPEKEAKAGPVAELKAERERIAQDVAAVKAREAAGPPASARTASDRKLAEERAVNLRVEAAAAALRLQVVERKIARALKLAEAAAVDRKRWVAHVKIGKKVLEPMQARFLQLAQLAERELKGKLQVEQSKAEHARDPIERYRAERLAELLELESAVLKAEQALTAGAQPSLEEMRSRANVAGVDFERIKKIIEGDESGRRRLDAFSINADYRRLEPERRRIQREERDVVDKRLRDYTNMLTSVELSQIEDRLLDQIDLDDLQDKLPPGRHPEAVAIWQELEERHGRLLARRREALEKLVLNEEEILVEIDRRLAILEDESSFIRTHLFWVRDQDPISLTTVGLAAGELRRLARVSIDVAGAAMRTSAWKRTTPEFLAASAVVVVLPLGILRARRTLKHRLTQALPPPPAPPAPAPAPTPPAEAAPGA